MKKENVVKKILLKGLVGFPLGVTLLILVYASVYFIADENMFNAELNQLHNIHTLISQIISAGIAGYVIFLSSYIAFTLSNYELEKKLMTEHPYKSVIITSISSICMFVIPMLLLANTKIFSKNISTLNLATLFIIYTLSAIVFGIKSVIEKQWIKEINQKIKERNY